MTRLWPPGPCDRLPQMLAPAPPRPICGKRTEEEETSMFNGLALSLVIIAALMIGVPAVMVWMLEAA